MITIANAYRSQRKKDKLKRKRREEFQALMDKKAELEQLVERQQLQLRQLRGSIVEYSSEMGYSVPRLENKEEKNKKKKDDCPITT